MLLNGRTIKYTVLHHLTQHRFHSCQKNPKTLQFRMRTQWHWTLLEWDGSVTLYDLQMNDLHVKSLQQLHLVLFCLFFLHLESFSIKNLYSLICKYIIKNASKSTLLLLKGSAFYSRSNMSHDPSFQYVDLKYYFLI